MPNKKKTFTEHQKNKCFKALYDIYNSDIDELNIEENDINFLNLISIATKHKNVFKFKQNIYYNIFKINNNKQFYILVNLEYPIEDKDTIKICEDKIKVVEFFEKVLINLDQANINNIDVGTNKFIIFLSIIKNIDENLIDKLNKKNKEIEKETGLND